MLSTRTAEARETNVVRNLSRSWRLQIPSVWNAFLNWATGKRKQTAPNDRRESRVYVKAPHFTSINKTLLEK